MAVADIIKNVNEVVEDIAGALKLYDDGSILRTDRHLIINVPPCEGNGGVASKDVVVDEVLGIWVRIYLPLSLVSKSTCFSKFPVLLYFHGGGFCFLSPAFIDSDRFCKKWAAAIGAVVVSVNYRLAPEHRLPAAYDDSMQVVGWLRSSRPHSEPWLNAYADFSNVFLVGESCGGNIVHHLLMRITASASEADEDGEFDIRGAILLQPFFGGEERTQSEIACPEEVRVSVKVCDTFWRLALPSGSDRDHPFCNPVKYLQLRFPLPPMFIVLGGKDCLKDRGAEYFEAIRKSGNCKHIELTLFDEEEHGFYHEEEELCDLNPNNIELLRQVALFVSSNRGADHLNNVLSADIPSLL